MTLFSRGLRAAAWRMQGKALMGASLEEMREHFDSNAYLEMYGDVAASGQDAFLHYIRHGWREGRAPLAGFDPAFYSESHLDGAGVCPLAHYAQTGAARRLPINPSQAAYSDWMRAEGDAWQDEIRRMLGALGVDAAAYGTAAFGRIVRAMFDPNSYRRARNLGADVTDTECFVRYLAFDFPAGKPPGPLFNEVAYLENLTSAGLSISTDESPFQHWLRVGLEAEIAPSRLYSAKEYAKMNGDFAGSGFLRLRHLLLHGLEEQRQFSRHFHIAKGTVTSGRSLARSFLEHFNSHHEAETELQAMQRFRDSETMVSLISKACQIDPDVTACTTHRGFLPPWHDPSFPNLQKAFARLPEGPFDAVVLIPFCKIGGADYVAGLLGRTLQDLGQRVLVLQTDQEDFVRPDWFEGLVRADISPVLKEASKEERARLLYAVLWKIAPRQIFNVNSKNGFETFTRFGRQLKQIASLNAYFFCADRDAQGVETGYPVWYFPKVFEHLTSAITDSAALRDDLARRFAIPVETASALRVFYTPVQGEVPRLSSKPPSKRPLVLWAGRLDRQKRFDILLDVARAMPEADFQCWGTPVMGDAVVPDTLPDNVTLRGAFKRYDEMPLQQSDLFFYTSDWDGVPTLLLEMARRGIPIVASAVGGVPEVIGKDGGACVPQGAPISEYVAAIRAKLSALDAQSRAAEIADHVSEQHSEKQYRSALAGLLEGEQAWSM